MTFKGRSCNNCNEKLYMSQWEGFVIGMSVFVIVFALPSDLIFKIPLALLFGFLLLILSALFIPLTTKKLL